MFNKNHLELVIFIIAVHLNLNMYELCIFTLVKKYLNEIHLYDHLCTMYYVQYYCRYT